MLCQQECWGLVHHISEFPKPSAIYLPVAGWVETHPGDAGAGFLPEEAENTLCYLVGWDPLGKVTGATSLAPPPLPPAGQVGA